MGGWRELPPPVAEEEIRQRYAADIVVVGLGYAGTAAVRAACESGASVIGIEQKTEERYTSYGRDIGHINSRFLRSRGVPEVDPIDLYNEMMRRAYNRANPTLVMKFAQNCGEAFDWFTDMYSLDELKDLHVAYWPEGASRFKAEPTHEYNGYHFWNGTAQFPDPRGWPGGPTLPDVVKRNFARIREQGGTLLFGLEVLQPVLEQGRMTAVICRDREGSLVRVGAARAIILAAGDFGGNGEMFQELVTDVSDMYRPDQGAPKRMGHKGRGIQLGVWAGGRLEPRPLPIMLGNIVNMYGFTSFGVLWLDRDGRRFCSENFGGPEIAGIPAAQMPQGVYYNIFDENILEDLQWAFPAHGGFDESNPAMRELLEEVVRTAVENPRGTSEPQKAVGKGMPIPFVIRDLYSGSTPEELAENAGLSGPLADQVACSIRRYNELCEKGRDDDFGKDPKLLRPLTGRLILQKSPQFGDYGFTLVTVGGLVTDGEQNVLDMNYEPIPGLYATGNCCGRRFGPMYTTPISGLSISMALTLGREVGKTAAKKS